MPKIDVPPTKTSLRKIKDDLSFAYEGFDLLNQKREILAMEIVKNIQSIKRIEKQLEVMLEKFYSNYRIAAIEMGSDTLSMKSSSEKRNYYLSIEFSRIMGMQLPVIRLKPGSMKKFSGFFGTTTAFDRTKESGRELLPLLANYATITKSIFILSRELKKVQRRVNALEKIFIPQNEQTKKYIQDRLEEMERDEIFVKRRIRERDTNLM